MSVTETPTPAATPIPLSFPPGSSVATVSGTVSAADTAVYSVEANAGQQLAVNVVAHQPPGAGLPGLVLGTSIVFPDGSRQGTPSSTSLDIVVTQSGTYVISIAVNRMISLLSGTYTLEVTLT
ncbi:MAG TPA: hypothetical protein VF006_07505 [Longimicrobium sp.]